MMHGFAWTTDEELGEIAEKQEQQEEEEEPGLAVGDLGHLAFEPLDEGLYSVALWEEFFYELRATAASATGGPGPGLQQAFDI